MDKTLLDWAAPESRKMLTIICGDCKAIDNVKARIAGELAGFKPIGTLGILLKAIKGHKLNLEEFFDDGKPTAQNNISIYFELIGIRFLKRIKNCASVHRLLCSSTSRSRRD